MTILSYIGVALSWLFGTAVFAAGIINTFWGNDPFFGIFLICLSVFYFLPADTLIRMTKRITTLSIGYGMTVLAKVLVAIFIIVSALGVGELPDKIDMMIVDLNL